MEITPFGEKVIKSGAWVFSTRAIQRLLFFIRTIILARLLSPNDFGLFGIALLALSMLDTFSQTGFRQALIQKKENINSYLDTAWTTGIIRGSLIAAILFAAAPYAAFFFKASRAEPILQIIGLAIILQSLTNIAVIYFEKELTFHKYSFYQLTGVVADVVVSVGAAFLFRSVWALVFGRLAGDLTRCVASYIIDPYRPRLRLDLSKAGELFGFGKWVLGSSILTFLILQGDDIFVGRLLGATALGFYQMAYFISNMPATEISHVISRVAFPAYSKMQDNISRLREAFLMTLKVTAFLSFSVAGLIFVLAPDFTRIFLGQKWMPMVPAMQVLVFAGLTRAIMATTGPIFQAVGKPKIETKWQIIRFAVLAVLIYPLTVRWGMAGTAITVFISAFISTIGFSKKAIEVTRCKLVEFSKALFIPLMMGIAIISVISILKFGITDVGILEFSLLVFAGFVCIVALVYLFEKLFNYKVRVLIKTLFVGLRGGL